MAQKLLIFKTNNCQQCERLEVTINQIKDTIEANNIKIKYLDAAANQELMKKYVVITVPTAILVSDDKEITRFYGARNQDYILKFIRLKGEMCN